MLFLLQAVKVHPGPNGMSRVGPSSFMTYHSILKSSKDYYTAIEAAREVANNITDMINEQLKAKGSNQTIEVFPYR